MQNRSFYTYNFLFSAIAPGVTLTVTQNVQALEDFDWLKGTHQTDIASAAQTDSGRVIPLATVLVVDSGRSYQLSNVAVPVESIFGTGGRPFILPAPYRFLRAGTISVALTNYSAATTYNIRLCMIGVKVT